MIKSFPTFFDHSKNSFVTFAQTVCTPWSFSSVLQHPSLNAPVIGLVPQITSGLLYTFRLLAGGAAIEINLSHWLLTFSFFVFLSLGTLKRYVDVDLDNVPALDRKKILSAGRGYIVADLTLLLVLGVSSGLISILIFLLYVSDPEVLLQYNSPHLLWLVAVALVYWISNIWFLANRNIISEDPVMFVLKDKSSRNTLIVMLSLVILAIYS